MSDFDRGEWETRTAERNAANWDDYAAGMRWDLSPYAPSDDDHVLEADRATRTDGCDVRSRQSDRGRIPRRGRNLESLRGDQTGR